jgi:hypothetical protein
MYYLGCIILVRGGPIPWMYSITHSMMPGCNFHVWFVSRLCVCVVVFCIVALSSCTTFAFTPQHVLPSSDHVRLLLATQHTDYLAPGLHHAAGIHRAHVQRQYLRDQTNKCLRQYNQTSGLHARILIENFDNTMAKPVKSKL